MTPALKLYYDGVSMESIANAHDVTFEVMKNRLTKERKKLNLSPRPIHRNITKEEAELIADKKIVIDLVVNHGLSMSEIGRKYEVHRKIVARHLSKWGVLFTNSGEDVEHWTLTDLYKNWVDAPAELIVNVGRRPVFRLVRIKG